MQVKDSKRFSKPKTSSTAFTVDHYAGNVTYETTNFLVGSDARLLDFPLGCCQFVYTNLLCLSVSSF